MHPTSFLLPQHTSSKTLYVHFKENFIRERLFLSDFLASPSKLVYALA